MSSTTATDSIRPEWSESAFAARVMISRKQLFVIVEGRMGDAAFYDRLMSANPNLPKDGYDIRLAEQIRLEGHARGGKPGILALYDYYRGKRKLRQVSKSGNRDMLFMLDKDMDDVARCKRRGGHIIYTVARDVEAEMHRHGDLVRALSTSLSLTDSEARKLHAILRTYMIDLAELWREWIILGTLSTAMKSRCSVQPGRHSAINVNVYGPLDFVELASARLSIIQGATTADPLIERSIRRAVRNIYKNGDITLLVKGKWLPSYLKWRLKQIGEDVLDINGINYISKNLLDTVDFTQSWVTPYHAAIDRLIL